MEIIVKTLKAKVTMGSGKIVVAWLVLGLIYWQARDT